MNGDAGLTVVRLRRQCERQLTEAGVEDPEVSAQRIVGEAVGVMPAELVLSADARVTAGAVARADQMTARRCEGEPLQYVLGRWGFRKLDLAVDARALIPRPETELIAGAVISALTGERVVNVADLGTGCGAIGLSIAQEVPQAHVYATDVCPHALELARENLAGLGIAGSKVTLACGDWFDALPANLAETLDAVVANPPYVAASEALAPSVEGFEPALALRAGPRGDEALTHIAHHARSWLTPGGTLVLECGHTQADALAEHATALGYDDVRQLTDTAGLGRGVVAQRPPDDPSASELRRAAEELTASGFLVAPTDTVCGVLGRWDDLAAVRKVFEAKQRPPQMSVPVFVSGVAQAAELIELDEQSLTLARRFWPGALTVVGRAVDRRRAGRPYGSPQDGTLAVRVPDAGWIRWLAGEVGPLTGTSANVHGSHTPSSADEAARSLAIEPSMVVAGDAPSSQPSTLVDVTGDTPKIVRAGVVSEHDVHQALARRE